MVYIDCFFYGINLTEEELNKYNFPKNNLQNSVNIDLKKFNKALDIHNFTIINKYRENKVLSISDLKSGNSNNLKEIQKNNSESKLTRTMKSYKSVRNLGDLEKIKENEINSQTSLFSDNINYLINKTSDIIINGINSIRQFPELIDYYNTYDVYD